MELFTHEGDHVLKEAHGADIATPQASKDKHQGNTDGKGNQKCGTLIDVFAQVDDGNT